MGSWRLLRARGRAGACHALAQAALADEILFEPP
jgi:hypothetical protein